MSRPAIHTTLAENSAIAAALTAVSLARSYLLRHAFERIGTGRDGAARLKRSGAQVCLRTPDHARPQAQPTELKLVTSNPGKRSLNANEPRPAHSIPTCPAHLNPSAKAEWKRLCQEMDSLGIISDPDKRDEEYARLEQPCPGHRSGSPSVRNRHAQLSRCSCRAAKLADYVLGRRRRRPARMRRISSYAEAGNLSRGLDRR